MTTEQFQDYYKKDNVTSTYDEQREGTKYRRTKRDKELKIFLELLDKKDGEMVLELGCSSGFLTKHLGEVYAIDTSTDMLKIARSKNNKAICFTGDMFDIEFKEETFDKVVTMRVWNHLDKDDLTRAIKEARRVLKSKGILVFDIEEKSSLRKIVSFFYQKVFRTTGFKIYQYSLVEIIKLLDLEGFHLQDYKYLNHRIGRQIILRCRKDLDSWKS